MFALLLTPSVLLETYVTHMHVMKLVKTTKKKPFYSLPQWTQDNHIFILFLFIFFYFEMNLLLFPSF